MAVAGGGLVTVGWEESVEGGVGLLTQSGFRSHIKGNEAFGPTDFTLHAQKARTVSPVDTLFHAQPGLIIYISRGTFQRETEPSVSDSRAGEGTPRTVDHAVIGGVVAVVVFAMLFLEDSLVGWEL
ncbi:hypothetical protein EYF80_010583 [Liparis tanakae]|uniref:Uncharacterized protein n=1 Tax=Liparis tanakae TaxID=230148 RepID=A0A4Z2IMQ6_9TELE|nr:hypothetical protein EYF80_010583 [Liparis tanakae]